MNLIQIQNLLNKLHIQFVVLPDGARLCLRVFTDNMRVNHTDFIFHPDGGSVRVTNE